MIHIAMDPAERLRKAFEMRQMMTGLRQFADRAEADSFEREWKDFLAKVAEPAFDSLKSVFGDKFEPLTEKTDPGFKVKDDPDSEFWFWISFRGRLPVAHGARKFKGASGLLTGTTPHLSSKPTFGISDITQQDVLEAVACAYERSPLPG